ncbi:MAG: DNA-directed RNA polymerase subunit N [Candidatus Aenigmarchaeota archaeon]|nr:DNA-directed RNA polymerase subunit N [Candidatus Aenigmarchaeota archaeon]
MLIPVRCLSCGRVISDKWEKFEKEVKAGKDSKKVLDTLGVESYCCRTAIISNVDLSEEISHFKRKTIAKD